MKTPTVVFVLASLAAIVLLAVGAFARNLPALLGALAVFAFGEMLANHLLRKQRNEGRATPESELYRTRF